MAHFLIEFRLHGYAKSYAKELIYGVAKKFRVEGVTTKRAVPHITLFGPFQTNNTNKIITEVERICQNYELVPFTIKGFGCFNRKMNKVIYLEIEPSPELKELRWKLAQQLGKISNTLPKDMQQRFQFHATIAFKDIDRKFDKIWAYIKAREEPDINQHLLRITILKDRTIIREYDLVLQRWLNRRQALSKYWWQKTVSNLREL